MCLYVNVYYVLCVCMGIIMYTCIVHVVHVVLVCGRLEKDIIHDKFPWVTHGKELRHLHLGLLMGRDYVLSLNVKCPKVGTLCNLLQGKIYVICLKRDIPAIPQRIDYEIKYESHLYSLKSHQRGTPAIDSYLT